MHAGHLQVVKTVNNIATKIGANATPYVYITKTGGAVEKSRQERYLLTVSETKIASYFLKAQAVSTVQQKLII